jgi:hypothetical protein
LAVLEGKILELPPFIVGNGTEKMGFFHFEKKIYWGGQLPALRIKGHFS